MNVIWKSKWLRGFVLVALLLIILRVVLYALTMNRVPIVEVIEQKQQDSLVFNWQSYQLWVQTYLQDWWKGDFGSLSVRANGQYESYQIVDMIVAMTKRSALTLLPGLLIGAVCGVLSGALVFYLPRKIREWVVSVNGLVFSIPDLLLILLLQLGAIQIDRWTERTTVGVVEVSKHPIFLLPILTVAVPIAAYLLSYTVNACREVFQQEYVRNIKGRGLPFTVILFKHVLRPASDSIFAVIPKMAAIAASSLVVIERLYNIMGITWYFNGITTFFPPQFARLLATILICMAVYIMAIKWVTSLLRLWANPSLRK